MSVSTLVYLEEIVCVYKALVLRLDHESRDQNSNSMNEASWKCCRIPGQATQGPYMAVNLSICHSFWCMSK